jgi:hypothetical protein
MLGGKCSQQEVYEHYFCNDFEKIVISSEAVEFDSKRIAVFEEFVHAYQIKPRVIAFLRDPYD